VAAFLTTPSDGYRRRQSPTLGGVEVQLLFRWADGPGAWYLDVDTAGGERVLSGVRITSGGYLWAAGQDPRLPPGSLVAIGPDPYRREQLGSDVRVAYLAPGESL
jgi:hypothetical protein